MALSGQGSEMPDHFKKVQSGDPLAIPAQTFNTFIDAAWAHRERQHQQAQTGTPTAPQGPELLMPETGSVRDPRQSEARRCAGHPGAKALLVLDG